MLVYPYPTHGPRCLQVRVPAILVGTLYLGGEGAWEVLELEHACRIPVCV